MANRSLMTVHVPESVHNLAQLKAGDRLTVRYDRALIAAVARPASRRRSRRPPWPPSARPPASARVARWAPRCVRR